MNELRELERLGRLENFGKDERLETSLRILDLLDALDTAVLGSAGASLEAAPSDEAGEGEGEAAWAVTSEEGAADEASTADEGSGAIVEDTMIESDDEVASVEEVTGADEGTGSAGDEDAASETEDAASDATAEVEAAALFSLWTVDVGGSVVDRTTDTDDSLEADEDEDDEAESELTVTTLGGPTAAIASVTERLALHLAYPRNQQLTIRKYIPEELTPVIPSIRAMGRSSTRSPVRFSDIMSDSLCELQKDQSEQEQG